MRERQNNENSTVVTLNIDTDSMFALFPYTSKVLEN